MDNAEKSSQLCKTRRAHVNWARPRASCTTFTGGWIIPGESRSAPRARTPLMFPGRPAGHSLPWRHLTERASRPPVTRPMPAHQVSIRTTVGMRPAEATPHRCHQMPGHLGNAPRSRPSRHSTDAPAPTRRNPTVPWPCPQTTDPQPAAAGPSVASAPPHASECSPTPGYRRSTTPLRQPAPCRRLVTRQGPRYRHPWRPLHLWLPSSSRPPPPSSLPDLAPKWLLRSFRSPSLDHLCPRWTPVSLGPWTRSYPCRTRPDCPPVLPASSGPSSSTHFGSSRPPVRRTAIPPSRRWQ